MILTQLVNVYFVILMKNFMRTVPKALVEAAKIDGAGEFYTFFRIVLPLAKPALASIGMFTALNLSSCRNDGHKTSGFAPAHFLIHIL